MAKTYQLNVQGYYRDEVRCLFPNSPGIYFVYRGVLNNVTRKCTLKELIYIGESSDLHERHNDHDRRPDFLASLSDGEMLFYTYALTNYNETERKRVEAALIYELLPPLNESNTKGFSYPETYVSVAGDRHAFVPDSIKAPSY